MLILESLPVWLIHNLHFTFVLLLINLGIVHKTLLGGWSFFLGGGPRFCHLSKDLQIFQGGGQFCQKMIIKQTNRA